MAKGYTDQYVPTKLTSRSSCISMSFACCHSAVCIWLIRKGRWACDEQPSQAKRVSLRRGTLVELHTSFELWIYRKEISGVLYVVLKCVQNPKLYLSWESLELFLQPAVFLAFLSAGRQWMWRLLHRNSMELEKWGKWLFDNVAPHAEKKF